VNVLIESIADLVAFLKRFHRHWLHDPSLDPALIPANLPPGLAAICRDLGALVEIDPGPDNGSRAPFATQDALMPVSRLERVKGMLEFAWENQSNWSARCPAEGPDPPVFSNAADSWDTVRRGFVVVCKSLNHFLTTLCLQEAVMSCRHLVALWTERPPDQVLTAPLRPLWLNGCSVTGEPDHQFFVSPDGDTLVMDWDGGWVGSPVHKVAELVAPGIGVRVLR
jgi:hypothetical protein